jgi:hypothetical protein
MRSMSIALQQRVPSKCKRMGDAERPGYRSVMRHGKQMGAYP